jgi:hypothetical protein
MKLFKNGGGHRGVLVGSCIQDEGGRLNICLRDWEIIESGMLIFGREPEVSVGQLL